MAEVTLENLNVNLPIVEIEQGMPTPYFEDWAYKVIEDLNAITASTVTGADNVGTGAEIYKQLASTLLEMRTIISSDASVTISQGTDEIDLTVSGSGLDPGTVANSILTWDAVGADWDELSEVAMSWSAGALSLTVEDSLGAGQLVMLADADDVLSLYHDGTATLRTAAVASGGAEANNTSTGAGWERVLTTSDLLTFGNWKTFYTDGSGVLTELALGATSGHVLTSNGAAAAPSWQAGGGGGLTYFQDGTTWGEVLYSTFVAFEADQFGIVINGVDTDVQPRINFLDDDSGTQVGNIRATSTGFVVDNRRTSSPLLLRAKDAALAVVNLLDGDPDAGVDLYYDATIQASTVVNGLTVFSGASSNAHMRVSDTNSETGLVRKLQTSQGGYTQLIGEENGQNVQLLSSDALGTDQLVLDGDPDGSVDLYFDSSITMETHASGLALVDSVGNDPFMSAYDSGGTGGTRLGFLQWNSTASRLRSERASLHWEIIAEDALGTAQNVIDADPDGPVQLLYDGDLTFETQLSGIRIYEKTGGAPAVEFTSSGGTRYGRLVATSTSFSFGSSNHGGDTSVTGENAVGTAVFHIVGDPDGAVTLYNDGDVTFYTRAQGAYISSDTTNPQLRLESGGVGGTLESILYHSTSNHTVILDARQAGDIISLQATQSPSGIVSILDGDPDGAVTLYYDGVAAFSTDAQGAIIADTSGNDPLLQFESDAGVDRGWIFFGDTSAYFWNQVISSITYLYGEDSASTLTTLISGDPDGQLDLYYDGVLAGFTTAAGMDIQDTSGSFPYLNALNDAAGSVWSIGTNATGALLYSLVNSAHWTIYGEDAGSVFTTMADFDPDGPVDLYYDGTLEAQTKSGGFRVDDELEIDGALNHDGSTVGFYGTAPAAQSAAYTRTATVVESRVLAASASATATNNNNVLAALIADLQNIGILG